MGMACRKYIHASYHQKLDWNTINWKKVSIKVKKLQMRIAKAVREGRYRLAKSLQGLLTHSFYAKLFAIRRVVTNKGRRTPGVDGEIWNTPQKNKFMYLTLKLCVLIRAMFYVAATPMGGFSFWGKKNPSLKLGGCHVNCQASPQIGTK